MYPADKVKAIAKSRNQANKILKNRYPEEWREIYIQECLKSGITLEDINHTPSITIARLEREVQELKKQLNGVN